MTALLQAQGLTLSFGSLAAVQDLDLSVPHGARHAVIGPNGAGKTTLVNILSGMQEAQKGIVKLDGRDITTLTADQRVRHGLVRTFQINSVFPQLSALASLAMVIFEREGMGRQWWRGARTQSHVYDEAASWLQKLGLSRIAGQHVAHLPYAQQRLLEIGLALACRPRVLLLDEPAAGLSASEGRAILEMIHTMPDSIAVVLIEHDMELVFGFAETISVLAHGRLVATGTPAQIAGDEQVRTVYLGSAWTQG